MPDHVHLALRGTSPEADLWKAMSLFKQLSGYRLARRSAAFRWQKDYFDHVIRGEDELATQLGYIAHNPVRRGLASRVDAYPFTGSDVFDLGKLTEDPA
jgi:REP element-mobilizing transposase RayT